METNKTHDWLKAIMISNYKTMWLAYHVEKKMGGVV
jgi:hypothetical protein